MATRQKIYIDWLNKKLKAGPNTSTPFTFPDLFQGDVTPYQITIIEPDPSDPTRYQIVDNANMALKMAVSAQPIGTAGSPTPFVTQFSWSKDSSIKAFYADVAFNTAELDTFLGSAHSAQAYLEFEITEGASVATAWQGIVTVKADVIEAATGAVAAGETLLSLEVARQMFATWLWEAGRQMISVSPDGTRQTVLHTDDDGSWHEDNL